MIPNTERGMLRLTLAVVEQCARDGEYATGYTSLMTELNEARRAVERGEPWGPDMVAAYEQAVEEYITRYRVRLD